MNIEHLQQLADYLKAEVKPSEFNMSRFHDHNSTWKTRRPIRWGCSARYITAIVDAEIFDKVTRADLHASVSLLYQYIGLSTVDERDALAIAWLFAGSWSMSDNTPIGAALRIEWLIKHGVPENWYNQLTGIDVLCYIPFNTVNRSDRITSNLKASHFNDDGFQFTSTDKCPVALSILEQYPMLSGKIDIGTTTANVNGRDFKIIGGYYAKEYYLDRETASGFDDKSTIIRQIEFQLL